MRRTLAIPFAALFTVTALSCKDSPTAPPDSAECATIQATFNVTLAPFTTTETGTLGTASCLLGRGSHADRWELVTTARFNIEIALQSEDFDAYVILRNSEDESIGSADDSPGTSDAVLAGTLQPGTYYIMASTYGDGEVGDYTLTITLTAPPVDS